jgi:predicted GIY-YIG superfamily endonuclease
MKSRKQARPGLRAELAQIELDIELSRIELGYRAAAAIELEHVRPDFVRHRAEVAVRIARHRQATGVPKCARAKEPGLVYLLHFDRRYRHAGHYTGWTESSGSLTARLARHASGDGARLLAVVHEAGISWQVARTWPGSRARERQLKRQGGAARHCPLCGYPRRGAR